MAGTNFQSMLFLSASSTKACALEAKYVSYCSKNFLRTSALLSCFTESTGIAEADAASEAETLFAFSSAYEEPEEARRNKEKNNTIGNIFLIIKFYAHLIKDTHKKILTFALEGKPKDVKRL